MSSLATVDIIEALIFASEEPLPLKQITEILQIPPHEAQEHLQELKVRKEAAGGLALMAVAGGYRLLTKPEYGDYVAKLREPKMVRLSKASLEVLAIIAYRQPVTHAEVDQIRGVDSSHSLKTLMDREMIYSPGRKEAPGRPLLYATSEDFLDHFGIGGIEDLPEMEEDVDAEPIMLFRRRAEELSHRDLTGADSLSPEPSETTES